MPLTVLGPDAVAYVRTQASIFFSDGTPRSFQCAQQLVAQLVALGVSEVFVSRSERWWAVGSLDRDWFLAGLPVESQFQRILPLPEMAPNASRAEILLLAFADDVAVLSGDELRVLAGTEPPTDFARRAQAKAPTRVIFFRFPATDAVQDGGT